MPIRTKFLLALTVAAITMLLAGSAWSQPNPGGASIAVLPFEVNTDKKDPAFSGIPQLLNKKLEALGIGTVDFTKMLSLIKERKVSYLDLETAKNLAVLGGAKYALYGSLSKVGSTLSLDARLVDSFGAAQAVPLFVVKEGSSDVSAALDELTEKIQTEVFKEASIAEIEVRGTKVLDKDVILMRLRLQKGDPVDPKKINEEIKRIFDLGYFEDVRSSVEPAAGGQRLVFEVVEKPRIQAIGVIGNSELDEDDILEVMSTKSGSVLNPKILAEDLEKIRELYREEGYYLASITHELEGEGEAMARLNIVVQEAKKLYITDIEIEGAEQLSEGELKDEMALSERSIISFITGTGILKEELLDRDSAAIESYYADRGFLDAKVAAPKVEYLEDGIHITFSVVEGKRYKIGSVVYTGDLLVPTEELLNLTAIDEEANNDNYLSRSVMREDAKSLTTFYNDFGYAYAETDIKLHKNKDTDTIDVTYIMSKNQKVYIRRVTIEGNDRTRDNVIRRELGLADGDLFSGTALRRSGERLERLDLFETFDIETVPTDDPKEMDIKVRVKEKATGMLAGGVGYGSYAGVYLSGKLTERNLFGKGYYLGFSGSFSAKDIKYELNFTNPRIYDTKLGAGVDAYYQTNEYPEFEKDTVGGRIRVFHPLGEYTVLSASYRLEKYDIKDTSVYSAWGLRSQSGDHWSSVITLSASRDSTNRKINPSEGSKNSISIDFGGGPLQGDDDYIKPILDTSWYFPIPLPFFKEHIFHWHAQAGALFNNFDGEAPIYERFYLGGMGSVRGYEGMRISPRDGYTHQLIGGDKKFFTNFEYIFPLDKEFGLVGLFFFDAGDAWEGSFGDINLKKSVGTGIRWFSPFGPLRLEYGYALDSIPSQDNPHRLEFSVGQFF